MSKTYEISELTLDQPRGIVVKNNNAYNFLDLVRKFSSGERPDTSVIPAPVHFSILKVKIKDGVFYYRDEMVPINYFIEHVSIESTGIQWNADTTAADFSFLSGIGSGGMKGHYVINFKNMDYRLGLTVNKFDLNILEQYLRDLTNYGNYSANLDANLKVKGNFKIAEDVTFTGQFAINDFHIGKSLNDDYASFKKLSLAIFELSPKNHKYLFDSVTLDRPYFKFEQYQYSNNLLKMFVTLSPATLTDNQIPSDRFNLVLVIGNYINQLSKNFFRSNYKINRLAIYNGDLKFNDFSVGEKFSVDFDPINIVADSIAKNLKRIHVFLRSGIKPYGIASMSVSINPVDSSDFDMHYQFREIPVALFNPYLIAYTSFPLDRGTIEVKGVWNVRNGNIQSINHLLIIDPRMSQRIKNQNAKWLPMRLIMAFVRERSNVIDYEIPITGNLKDPKFHLRDALMDVLGNILIKPPTTPYGIQIRNIETEIEKSLTLKWGMRESSLTKAQEKFIEHMAHFLDNNPEAAIRVHPQLYVLKEKEYLLFFEAKKKYFMAVNRKNDKTLSGEDFENIDKMSVKDASFVRYLNKQTHDPLLFTIQDKCNRLIGGALIDTRYNQLTEAREKAFMQYFTKKNLGKQIRFSHPENIIPYNGYSFYKIDYNGDYPNSLKKAYRKMNHLNDKAPGNLFEYERNQNRGRL